MLHVVATQPAPDAARAYLARAVGVLPRATLHALTADLGVMERYGCPLPAAPEQVARFVRVAAQGRARATVLRYLSSCAHLHRALGHPDPTKSEAVAWEVKRLRASTSGAQRQAAPLAREQVDAMLAAMGGGVLDLRDAALVALMYDTAFRRSEAVALDWADLGPVANDGSRTVVLRRSKTDQGAVGATAYLAPDTAARLAAWEAVCPPGGAMFTSYTGQRLGDGDVSRILKRRAARAGVPSSAVSGHSLRVGATCDMLAAGLELAEVMHSNRWRTPAMPMRYGAALLAQRSAAAKLAQAQGRV